MNIVFLNKRNKYCRKLILILTKILSIFNKYLPKRYNNILFYDSLNDTLTDNSLALLLYLQKNHYDSKYRIFCCVPKCKFSKIHGVENVGIIKGIYIYLISKYVFFSFGGMRILPSATQCVVNLWHGTPLKNIGKLNVNDKFLINENNNDFTYILSSAAMFNHIYQKAFACRAEQIIVQGQPRNDFLLSDHYTLDSIGIDKNNYKKIILWMPTFRVTKDSRYKDISKINKTQIPLFREWYELFEFNEFLKREKLLIVLKVHRYSIMPELNYSNIKIITDSDLDAKNIVLYNFIKDSDALLTDYSSVFFDYLLLNKPIGFIVDDIGDYLKHRGFTVTDPLKFMSGEHIYNINDLKEYCLNVAIEYDEFKEERRILNEKVNFYKSDFCARLLKYLRIGD